jgi:hypothetical protein
MIHTAEITGTSVKQERDGGVSLVLSTRDTNGITHDFVVSGVTYHAANNYLDQKRWFEIQARIDKAVGILEASQFSDVPREGTTERRVMTAAAIRKAVGILRGCL